MAIENQSQSLPAQEAGVSHRLKTLFPPAAATATAPSSRSVFPALSSSRHSLNTTSTATASTATTTASSSEDEFDEEEEAEEGEGVQSLATSISDLGDASSNIKQISKRGLSRQELQVQRDLKRRVGPLSYGPLPVASLAELDASSQPTPPTPHPEAAPWVSVWQARFLKGDARRKAYQQQCPWATVYNARPLTKMQQQGAGGKSDTGVEPRVGMSPIIFGAGTFGTGQYAEEDQMMSIEPVRALRLAFQYGINTFDASPYYRNSEAILGRCLRVLRDEFPRWSYYISTKCGRYGPNLSQFDYSPERIRQSVMESLARFDATDVEDEGEQQQGGNWLDNVFLHDAEFICDQIGAGHQAGMHSERAVRPATSASGMSEREALRASMGISDTFASASRVHGAGDRKILAAAQELFRLQDEGKIKMVGLSGYPLPVLLRLSRMIATNHPYRPIDTILSYSNHTLHSDLLPLYLSEFDKDPWQFADAPVDGTQPGAWKSPLVMNASPFSMGLLTEAGPPAWHPASDALQSARSESVAAVRAISEQAPIPVTLAQTALHYGIQGSEQWDDSTHQQQQQGGEVPALRTLAGLANAQQVHQVVEAYRARLAASPSIPGARLICPPTIGSDHHRQASSTKKESERAETLQKAQEAVLEIMKKHNIFGESWQSPPEAAMKA